MKHLFFFFTFFIYSLYPFAQIDTLKTTLSEIVVTANRTETPYYSLASSVTVITSDEISKKHYNTVVELLREVPGLSIVQQGGYGKIANLFMRGSNSNHTLVFIDGVKVNDASSPNNAFDFSTLNVGDIEKIEIVRGPQSTLYGSDAIAGVINIITKTYNKKKNYSLSIEGGSYSSFKGNLSLSGKYRIAEYYVYGSNIQSKGISASNSKYGNTEKDGYNNNSFTSKLNFNLLSNLKLGLIYKYIKLKTDIDQNDKFGDDPNYNYNTEEQLFKSELNASLLDNKWQQIFSFSMFKKLSKSIDDPDDIRPFSSSNSMYNGKRVKFDWQNNFYFLKNNLITFGIETELEKANSYYSSLSQWGPYESIFPDKSIRTIGFYFQDHLNLFNSIFSSLGIRIDKNEKYGMVTTFRLAPAYYIHSSNTKIKMSYGTGFKAPSLYYLFDPLYGNPELKPEKSRGFDIGIEQFLLNGKIAIGINYFNLRISDMFGYDANFKTINVAKAISKGIEIYSTISNLSRIIVDANYTYNETKDEYEESPDFNMQLLRRPKHQFNVNVGYQVNEKIMLNASLKYVGKKYDKDFTVYPSKRVIINDYTLINFSMSYELFNYLEIYGRIENLFNKDYEEVLYYGTPGRSFYLGFNVSL